MLVCKKDKVFRCCNMIANVFQDVLTINFSICESVERFQIMDMFEKGVFFFYDDMFGCNWKDADNTELIELGITYNDDLTYGVKIRLKKGDGSNES